MIKSVAAAIDIGLFATSAAAIELVPRQQGRGGFINLGRGAVYGEDDHDHDIDFTTMRAHPYRSVYCAVLKRLELSECDSLGITSQLPAEIQS